MKKLLIIELMALMAFTSGCGFVQSTLADSPTLSPQDLYVILRTPPNDSTTSLRPEFSWLSRPGVTEYKFTLATDAAITNIVISADLTETSFQLPFDLQPNTTYFWAVRPTKPTPGRHVVNTFTTVTTPSQGIAVDEAITIASRYLPTDIAKNWGIDADLKTDISGSYWEVCFSWFDGITNEQLGWQSDNKTDLIGAYYNTIYFRIDAVTGELLYRKASSESFSVIPSGPILQVISSPSSLRPDFSWAPYPNATEYEFILATDAALTQTVAGTPVKVTTTALSLSADLQPNTIYYWAVRASAPTKGVQTIDTFTTMAPVVTTPPVTSTVTKPPPSIPPPPTATATETAPAPGTSGTNWWLIGGLVSGVIISVVLVSLLVLRKYSKSKVSD